MEQMWQEDRPRIAPVDGGSWSASACGDPRPRRANAQPFVHAHALGCALLVGLAIFGSTGSPFTAEAPAAAGDVVAPASRPTTRSVEQRRAAADGLRREFLLTLEFQNVTPEMRAFLRDPPPAYFLLSSQLLGVTPDYELLVIDPPKINAVVDRLLSDGFFAHGRDERNFPPATRPRAVLSGAGLWEDLGWDEQTLRRLESLRSVLQGPSAQAMAHWAEACKFLTRLDENVVYDDGTGAQICFVLPTQGASDAGIIEYHTFRIFAARDGKTVLMADLAGRKSDDGKFFVGQIIIPSALVDSAEILLSGGPRNTTMGVSQTMKVRDIKRIKRPKSWTQQP